MSAEGTPVVLTLPSDLRLVSVARAFVEAVCHAAGLDGATTNAVVLATNEAANNVVRHAHLGRPDTLFQIRCQLHDDHIEICVLDDGQPFNLDAVPRMDPTELRIGGRGIFLMRSVMDEVTCERRGDSGNNIRMVKHCQCRHPSK